MGCMSFRPLKGAVVRRGIGWDQCHKNLRQISYLVYTGQSASIIARISINLWTGFSAVPIKT